MDEFKNAIVITGGIATGKSEVCKILKNRGFDIIDADEISHEILDNSFKEILKNFGENLVDLKTKKIKRKILGDFVFKNKNKLEILEKILHPKIRFKIYENAKNLEKKNRIYFIDIPLFFEKQNYDFKRILLIYAPKDLQIQRLKARNSLDFENANLRINSQIDIEKKLNLANFVIKNLTNLKDLEKKVDEFLKKVEK